MFLDSFVIPAWRSVNGSTIVRKGRFDRVGYNHSELDDHDVLLAEARLPKASSTMIAETWFKTFANSLNFTPISQKRACSRVTNLTLTNNPIPDISRMRRRIA